MGTHVAMFSHPLIYHYLHLLIESDEYRGYSKMGNFQKTETTYLKRVTSFKINAKHAFVKKIRLKRLDDDLP